MTSTGSARQTLIDEAGAEEVSVLAAGSATSVLIAGSGRPVLLLHGFNPAGGLVSWPVFPGLSDSFRVIAPDLPGLGESEALSARLNPHRVVEWLNAVVEGCCHEPLTLVATSLSGGFALRFAAAHGERLRELVLTDAQGLAPFRPPPGFMVLTTLNRIRPSLTTARRLAGYLIHDEDHVRGLHGSTFEAFIEYMVSQTGRRGFREAMSGYATRAIARPVSASTLDHIETPVGLIWGKRDRPFPVSIAEAAHSRFGWPLEIIEDAGHLPYVERPARFTHAVEALARHD